jgi:hypothetical protein
MITFFNGHRRGLGENPAPTVYAQIDVSFREHLSHFKGARLAVLLAIALHANEEGWSWPSYETLAQETGYSEDAIRRALQDLCALEINGQRVLLRYQPPAGGNKTFESNRYLLFPSPEEVAQYEGMGTKHLGAETGGGFRRGKMPRREFPVVAKCHDEQTPIIGILIDQEEQEEEKEESGTSEIAKTLTENGVFPDVAREIAERMAGAGLSAEDALAILLGFQSLSRDSGRLNDIGCVQRWDLDLVFQSLSRDSGRLNSRIEHGHRPPSPPFQSLSRDSGRLNPGAGQHLSAGDGAFQSLSRDSGRLNP